MPFHERQRNDLTAVRTDVVTAVDTLATAIPIRVDAIAEDDPSDMTDAVAAFIDSIETNTSGASIWDPIREEMRTCTSGLTVGTPGTPPTVDYFETVDPGVSVCFDIIPQRNTTIPATTVPLRPNVEAATGADFALEDEAGSDSADLGVDTEFRDIFGAGADAEPSSQSDGTLPGAALDETSVSMAGDIDEIQTKLDLAQAYVDMGDNEGARGILDEVMQEGNDGQREQAKTLIDKLGE